MSVEDLLGDEPGAVIRPGDDGYLEAATSESRVGSPLAIVRPRTPAGVARAVRAATRERLPISVRSGGHTAWGTNDGGIVIDLAELADIEVSGDLVRVGGGARWGDVAITLAEHGLALSSGDTASVGVGGLALGGGIGWMVRSQGLTIDNLLGVELVTASGEVVRADDGENPELFWALRGGGGNFGIVTRFDFRARRLGAIIAGTFDYDLGDLVPVTRLWRDAMAAAPDELTATLVSMPPLGPEMPASLQIIAAWAGDSIEAARAATAAFAGHPGARGGELAAVPYRSLLDDDIDMGGPPPLMAFTSDFFGRFDDQLVEELARVHRAFENSMLMLRSLGGAYSRVPRDATAFAHRDADVLALLVAFFPPDAPAELSDAVYAQWRAATRDRSLGTYGNFRNDESPTLLDEMYPSATLARLRAVKKVWDPENVFTHNHNIVPV